MEDSVGNISEVREEEGGANNENEPQEEDVEEEEEEEEDYEMKFAPEYHSESDPDNTTVKD